MARTLFQERLRYYLVKEEELQTKSCAYAIISTMLVCALAFVLFDWISDTLGKWRWLFYLCFFSTLAVYGRRKKGAKDTQQQLSGGRQALRSERPGLSPCVATAESPTTRRMLHIGLELAKLVSFTLVVVLGCYVFGRIGDAFGGWVVAAIMATGLAPLYFHDRQAKARSSECPHCGSRVRTPDD